MASDRDSGGIQAAENSTAENKSPLPNSSSMQDREECEEKDSTDKGDDKGENNRRLWIGNLSPKLTEGYAFITYNHAEDAKKCLEGLDGKKVLDKILSVRYAHQAANVFTDEEEKLRKKLPALGMKPDTEVKPVSKERAISAIEAKLRAMEREKEEASNFSLTVVGSSQKGNVKSQNTPRNYPYANKSSTTQYDARSRPKPYTRYPPYKRY